MIEREYNALKPSSKTSGVHVYYSQEHMCEFVKNPTQINHCTKKEAV